MKNEDVKIKFVYSNESIDEAEKRKKFESFIQLLVMLGKENEDIFKDDL